MSRAFHDVPDPLFSALASGSGGDKACQVLARAQHSKSLLLIRGLLDVVTATGHPDQPLVRAAYDLLADLQRPSPQDGEPAAGTPETDASAAVTDVLRHPAVTAWAWHAYRACHVTGAHVPEDGHRTGGPQPRIAPGRAEVTSGVLRRPARPGRLAAVAAAAGVRSGRDFAIDVPIEDGGVLLPSLGRAVLPSAALKARVRSRRGVAEVIAGQDRIPIPRDPHQDAPGWQAMRRLSATGDGRTVALIVDDADPFRMPGARLAAGRLTEREIRRWQELLTAAWRLLLAHHWTTAEELVVTARALTPLVTVSGDLISSSSTETFGSIALSAPGDAKSLALTFAHELQHAKLTSLLDVTPLLRRHDGGRYFAPWRDDPRPLGGLLQGTYAYLGVAGFWRRQRHHEPSADLVIEAATEFWRWRTAAEETAQVIADSGRLTARGSRFVELMLGTLRDWRDEPVPAAAIAAARERARRHRVLWESRHGTP